MRKSSKQREIMLDFIQSSNTHYSANQIYDELQKEGEQISLATVYRNLGILVELGQIRKITLPSERVVYDREYKPHYHLHCVDCDQLFDLLITYKSDWDAQLQEEIGMSVLEHELTIHGVCPTCANQKKS